MTATLFPAFKLRDEWAEAVKENAILGEPFDGTLDEEDALRLLAYWNTDGKGVTRDKILKMKHGVVKAPDGQMPSMPWSRQSSFYGTNVV